MPGIHGFKNYLPRDYIEGVEIETCVDRRSISLDVTSSYERG
jgi:hypothetical protein